MSSTGAAPEPPKAEASAEAQPQNPQNDKKKEKERQKAEKAKKLAEKLAKQKQQQEATTSKKAAAATKAATAVPEYVEKTPKGEKKILGPLDSPHHSAYHPKVVESAWNEWWETKGFFQPQFGPDNKTLPPGYFVIPIPPPNVTGALHCGHALGTALQDLLIRWHRMRGFTTLYVPGYDHASISTQSVVEKMLWRKEKKTRHDLGRAEFMKRALEWKDEYRTKINTALRRLAGSFDWTREAFTMDHDRSAAVAEAFVQLHDEGLIYRANRLVNWCVHLNTTISNLEVDKLELSTRTLLDVPGYDRKVEFGVMSYFKYPIEDSDEFIEIGTTRIETMLGDTAVAVHPEDARYTHLHGKFVKHPFSPERKIRIVTDTHCDPTVGTGAVKITPAHDQNDFDIGVRHNLESINILTDDGKINANGGKFAGQKRYDARYAITEELTQMGLFVKKENNPMTIRRCSKSKDIVEPLLKPQWWMKMRGLADEAIRVVREGEIKIMPESAEKNYYNWLNNINDWCLSRQLWWGHQVPAWRVTVDGESEAEEQWIVARSEEEAQQKAAEKYAGKKFQLTKDSDVLDTWFSSGLWPFATLGWPKKTHDMENLFPTSVLETGWDILFFWVARMIMLSLKLTGKVPFKEVYCHSLIRDAQGRKMSKSLGNVIDPLDVMDGITLPELQEKLKQGNLDDKELKTASKGQQEQFPNGIPECGADALRYSLINYTTGGGDINFDVKVMAGFRRFGNKIYQATKYVLGKLDANYVPPKSFTRTGSETLPERWIIHKLNHTAQLLHQALSDREFSRASQLVYQYFYDSLCDVYIENSKAIIQDGSEEEKISATNTLYNALEAGLLFLHPFMPYLTEELWQRLPRRPGDSIVSIVNAAFPEFREQFVDTEAEAKYGTILSCSQAIRSLLAEYRVKEGKAFICSTDAAEYNLVQSELQQIRALATKAVSSIEVVEKHWQEAVSTTCAVYTITPVTTVLLDVTDTADAPLVKKLQEKLGKSQDAIEKQRKLVEGEDWSQKASAAVRESEQQKLTSAEAEARNLELSLKQFEKLNLGA